MNKVFLAGNLTRDPEIRYVPSGSSVAKMRVATNRKYKTSGGEWKEETTYADAEVWGKSAEWAAEHLHKGDAVLIEGRLKLREWEHDGQKRSQLEVAVDRVQGMMASRRDGTEFPDPAGPEAGA